MKSKFTDIIEALVQDTPLVFGGIQTTKNPYDILSAKSKNNSGQRLANNIMAGIKGQQVASDIMAGIKGQQVASDIMAGINQTAAEMKGQQVASNIMAGINQTAAEMASANLVDRVRGSIQLPKPRGEYSPVAGEQPMDAAVSKFRTQPSPQGTQTNVPVAGSNQKPTEYEYPETFVGAPKPPTSAPKPPTSAPKGRASLQKPDNVSQKDWDSLDLRRQAEWYENERKVQQRLRATQQPVIDLLSPEAEEARRQQRVRTGDHGGRVVQAGEVVSPWQGDTFRPGDIVGPGGTIMRGGLVGADWSRSTPMNTSGYYTYPHPKAGLPISAKDRASIKERTGVDLPVRTQPLPRGSNLATGETPEQVAAKEAERKARRAAEEKAKQTQVAESFKFRFNHGHLKSLLEQGGGGFGGGRGSRQDVKTDAEKEMEDYINNAKQKLGSMYSVIEPYIKGTYEKAKGAIRDYVKPLAVEGGILLTPPREIGPTITGRLQELGFTKEGAKGRKDYYTKTLGLPTEVGNLLTKALYDPRS